MKKKIIIFGASGGTGKHLVQQSLAEGYEVSVFVRQPEKLNGVQRKVKVFQGDVLDINSVKDSIQGHDAVLCSLGAPASDRTSIREHGTQNIVQAMKETSVNRLICQTSLGFGDSKEILPWHMKYLIVPFILKHAFKDHELQERQIEKTDLDWTIVRPGNMTNGALTKSYQSGFAADANIKLKVSRADVAHFMLQLLEEEQAYGKKLGVSY